MPAVVFDLDGTLIHSAPDIHAAVSGMLEEEGFEPLAFDRVVSFVGNGIPVLVSRVMATLDIEPEPVRHERMVAAMLRHYHDDPATLSKLYPGVIDALDALASDGCLMAVCTNKPEAPAANILSLFGLSKYFGAVVGGDTFPERKPHPRPLHETFRRLGVESGVFVGDSEVDAETAARFECPFLLYSEGYRKAPVEDLCHTAVFNDFADLPKLVTRLGAKAV